MNPGPLRREKLRYSSPYCLAVRDVRNLEYLYFRAKTYPGPIFEIFAWPFTRQRLFDDNPLFSL